MPSLATPLRLHTRADPRLLRTPQLRVLYESHLIAREDETGDSHDPDHSFISADVERYFQNEVPPAERVKRQITKERAIRGEVVDEEKKVHRSRLEETLGGRA